MDTATRDLPHQDTAHHSPGPPRSNQRCYRGATMGSSVWLCAPGPDEPDPDIPRWASGVIAEYSRPGQRVEVRVAAPYLGAAGEVAAVLHAAASTGREPVAMLPTPTLAAHTRRLLPAFTHHPDPHLGPDLGVASGPVDVSVAPHRPRVLVEGPDVAPEAAAALVVVLAGPIGPDAVSPPAHLTSAALAGWARRLPPEGTLVLLRPPQPPATNGGTNSGTNQGGGCMALVAVAARAGLSYAQHVVLLHVPVVGDRVAAAVDPGAVDPGGRTRFTRSIPMRSSSPR